MKKLTSRINTIRKQASSTVGRSPEPEAALDFSNKKHTALMDADFSTEQNPDLDRDISFFPIPEVIEADVRDVLKITNFLKN